MNDPSGREEGFFKKDIHQGWCPRGDFPIFSSKEIRGHTFIYFDSAATTHKPHKVIGAMNEFYVHRYGTVHRAVYELAAKATEEYNSSRKKVARFINAVSNEEIVFTSGTTDSINLVARSFGQAFLAAGDEVIISAAEHHANIVPWQMLVIEKKIKLKVVPVDDQGYFDLDTFKTLLSKRTKLVSVAYMTNTTGAIYPVGEIITLAHEMGAKVLIDAAQAVGHMPIDVQAMNADFLAFSAHKLYGPTGVGILYGKQALLEQMPPHKGGGDMITKVTFEKTSYQKPPLRFEAGTPMIAEVIGLGAAIEYVETLGFRQIGAIETVLLNHATKKLKEIPGLSIIGTTANKGPIVTFHIQGAHPLDVGTLLSLKGISIRTGQMCAEPILNRFGLAQAMRISFGVYNTVEEVDKFISLLQETMLLIKPEISY
jgi:cysteine desulfurase / selenocysteine lyase